MQNNLILFFIFDSDSIFFCGIQKKISIFKQLRILVVIGTWQSWKAQVNHFDPVWSSLFMIGIRLITGSVFLTNIHTTCTHEIPFTFIPCFPLWYLFTISICLFVCFCFLIFQFQLQIFCTFQSCPEAILGVFNLSHRYFFCIATTTLRSSWFWSWCKFEYFFLFATFFMSGVLSDLRYFTFLWWLPNWCALKHREEISRLNFCLSSWWYNL